MLRWKYWNCSIISFEIITKYNKNRTVTKCKQTLPLISDLFYSLNLTYSLDSFPVSTEVDTTFYENFRIIFTIIIYQKHNS